MIVVDHKDRIFETVRSAYYHKHGDVRLCTVMVSSMAFEDVHPWNSKLAMGKEFGIWVSKVITLTRVRKCVRLYVSLSLRGKFLRLWMERGYSSPLRQ